MATIYLETKDWRRHITKYLVKGSEPEEFQRPRSEAEHTHETDVAFYSEDSSPKGCPINVMNEH
jgi:hypothetical protein